MKPRGVRKVVIDDIIASGADRIMAHRHLRGDAGKEGRGSGEVRGGGGREKRLEKSIVRATL